MKPIIGPLASFASDSRRHPELRETLPLSFLLACTAALLALSACTASERTAEAQIEGRGGDNFAALQVRLWTGIPSQKVEGILVVALGSGMNGLHLADDPEWRQLARSQGLALGAVQGIESGGRHSWHQAEHGSGRAFFLALEEACRQAGMPEASARPIYIIGLSTGGQFGYHLALLFPDRVGGFVTLKGGHHRLPEPSDALSVPGLLVSGENDMPFRVENMAALAAAGREKRAPWLHVVDPGTGHESERVTRLLPSWLQAVRAGAFLSAEFQRNVDAYLLDPANINTPALSLESHQPAPVATLSTTTLDLGSWPWAEGSKPGTLTVHPAPGASWDRIEACSVKSLYNVRVEGSVAMGFTIQVQANPCAEPLTAPIRDEVRITYFQGSRKLLACDRLTLHSRSSGPLRAVPGTLLAAAAPSPISTLHLKIIPTMPSPLWRMEHAEAEGGLSVLHWSSRPDGSGGFQVEVKVQAQPDLHGNLSGTLHLLATSQDASPPQRATIHVPYIGKLAGSPP